MSRVVKFFLSSFIILPEIRYEAHHPDQIADQPPCMEYMDLSPAGSQNERELEPCSLFGRPLNLPAIA